MHGKPYQVRKGEKPMWIWAPRPFTKLEMVEEEEHEGCRFVLVPVFDASQIMHGKDPDGRGTYTFATVLYPAVLK